MALYNNGYPATYQQYYPQYQQPMYQQPMQTQQVQAVPQMQNPQPQDGNGIIWISGIEGAKGYLVAPGKSVMLMDAEASTFYIKSTDASGMPLPLRIFDYTERTQQTQPHSPITEQSAPQPEIDLSGYITRDEFEKRISELSQKPQTTTTVKKVGKTDG